MYKNKKLTEKNIWLLIGISFIVLLFAYPAILSFDIFNYIATAKVTFFYHENPYIIMPIEFLHDPLLLFMHAGNKTALYGPFWIGLTSLPFGLGFGSFLLTLLQFKLFVALWYFGTLIVLKKLSKDIITVLLFALNPLVLIETMISGHNDMVMVCLFLLSFLFIKSKKTLLAVIFIILSILIKYTSIFLLPIFVYLIFKNIRKQTINWDKIFICSGVLMFIIFLLSAFREEIYPWYAIWFLPFGFLQYKNKFLLAFCLVFSFGLLFRYVPFMLLGTYFGPTPIIKIIVTFVPPLLVSFYFLSKKIWSRK
jgi:hypothetical protein